MFDADIGETGLSPATGGDAENIAGATLKSDGTEIIAQYELPELYAHTKTYSVLDGIDTVGGINPGHSLK